MKNKDADPHSELPLLDVISAIRDRRSVRAFLSTEVSPDILTKILDMAKWGPSGVNTQPWQVAVLGPKLRQSLSDAIIKAREDNVPENPDYDYYPKTWEEPYKSRRKACGLALYSSLNIQIDEVEKRKAQWYRNYHFFDAPVGLIFYLEAKLCKGSWMDTAMFIQNVMLAARAFGLETCAQASMAEYPGIVREHLKLTSDYHIVCGMSMGYADWSAPVNQYRTTRLEVDQFTTWFD